VAKQEQNGRAATLIRRLNPNQREQEYSRMIGKGN
jgi:DNA repair ATPase RecN